MPIGAAVFSVMGFEALVKASFIRVVSSVRISVEGSFSSVGLLIVSGRPETEELGNGYGEDVGGGRFMNLE